MLNRIPGYSLLPKHLNRIYYLHSAYFFLGVTIQLSSFTVRKDLQSHALSLARIGSITAFLYIPWVFKPIYGFVSDRWALWRGLHRRPYVIISNLMCSLMSFTVVVIPHTAMTYILVLFSVQFFATFADVVMDAMMVEESMFEDADKKGRLQARLWQFRYGGLAMSIFLGAKIYEDFGSKVIFALQSLTYLVQAYTATLTTERGELQTEVPRTLQLDEQGETSTVVTSPLEEELEPLHLRRKKMTLWEHLTLVFHCLLHPFVGKILLFNFLREIKPTADLALFFYFLDQLHFTPTMVGGMGLVAELFKYLTISFFNRYLRGYKIRGLIIGCFTVIVLLNLILPLIVIDSYRVASGVNVYALLVILDSLDSCADEVITLPVLISTTFASDRDVSGTVYSANLAISNLAGILNGFLSSLIMHLYSIDHGQFQNLLSLLLVSSTFSLLLMLLIWLIPNKTLETLAREFDQQKKDKEVGEWVKV